jgi:hypothetical protein
VRKATLGELDPIMTAMYKWSMVATGAHVKFWDPDAVRSYVRESIIDGRVRFVGGYMVMFDTGSDWFTNAVFLIEKIVLKVYEHDKTATAQDAANSIPLLAHEYGVAASFAGDTQNGYMTAKYQSAGFSVLGVQLIKEN